MIPDYSDSKDDPEVVPYSDDLAIIGACSFCVFIWEKYY